MSAIKPDADPHRKPHAAAKLKTLPEEAQARIAGWCAEGTLDDAVSRCFSELSPPVETNRTSMGEFFKWWKMRRKFSDFTTIATTQAEMEAELRGGMTAEQMEAAVDRNFLTLAASAEDPKLYAELRHLRIRSEEARSNSEIALAKLAQQERRLGQKDEEIKLANRRVDMLVAAAEKAKAALAGIKTRGGLTPETLREIEEAAKLL